MYQVIATALALLGGAVGFATVMVMGLPILEWTDAAHRADAVAAVLAGTAMGVVLSLAAGFAGRILGGWLLRDRRGTRGVEVSARVPG